MNIAQLLWKENLFEKKFVRICYHTSLLNQDVEYIKLNFANSEILSKYFPNIIHESDHDFAIQLVDFINNLEYGSLVDEELVRICLKTSKFYTHDGNNENVYNDLYEGNYKRSSRRH